MQWSKLKTRIRLRIHPELRERIDLHLTSYRRSHDGADKVWITIDGVRVFSAKHYQYYRAEHWELVEGSGIEGARHNLAKREIHGPNGFGDSMREYLDIPVAEALASDDTLIRAFAIIDRRAGKRSLAKMEIFSTDHKLVKAFYQLRTAREWIM
jgi:hypothetical protein